VSPGASLWLRLGVATSVAAACLAALAPPHPDGRLSAAGASAVGLCCGVVLFAVLARARPILGAPGRRLPLLAGRVAVFGLWAANEEVMWRRVALGELLAAGAVPALVASTIGFALFHRARSVHLGTGGAFGALYLGTGALAASIAAHWTYNVLVAAAVERRRE